MKQNIVWYWNESTNSIIILLNGISVLFLSYILLGGINIKTFFSFKKKYVTFLCQ